MNSTYTIKLIECTHITKKCPIQMYKCTSLMMNICSKYAVLSTFVMVYNIWSDKHVSRRPTEVIPGPRGLGANVW